MSESILSDRPDGVGYYYGFREGDHRQINVRYEGGWWRAYVGGDQLPTRYAYKMAAEVGAIEWAQANPESSSQQGTPTRIEWATTHPESSSQ